MFCCAISRGVAKPKKVFIFPTLEGYLRDGNTPNVSGGLELLRSNVGNRDDVVDALEYTCGQRAEKLGHKGTAGQTPWRTFMTARRLSLSPGLFLWKESTRDIPSVNLRPTLISGTFTAPKVEPRFIKPTSFPATLGKQLKTDNELPPDYLNHQAMQRARPATSSGNVPRGRLRPAPLPWSRQCGESGWCWGNFAGT